MMGSSERTKSCVYLLDFGLSRFYRSDKGDLFPPRARPGFVGSIRYASRNAHDGRVSGLASPSPHFTSSDTFSLQELGRGDDLMSLFYVVIEMRRGSLPWRNIGARNLVREMKKNVKMDQLCQDLPSKLLELGQAIEPLK